MGASCSSVVLLRNSSLFRPSCPILGTSFWLHVAGRSGGWCFANKGLLAGLWSFPEVGGCDTRPDMGVDAARSRESVLTTVVERGLVATGCPEALPRVAHRFTHLHATYEPWMVPVAAPDEGEGRAWIDPAASNVLAVPVAQQKVLAFANERTEAEARSSY